MPAGCVLFFHGVSSGRAVDKAVDDVKHPTESPKKKVKKHDTYKDGDLRFFLQKGLKVDKSPYDVLSENFFIDDMTDWIEDVRK